MQEFERVFTQTPREGFPWTILIAPPR